MTVHNWNESRNRQVQKMIDCRLFMNGKSCTIESWWDYYKVICWSLAANWMDSWMDLGFIHKLRVSVLQRRLALPLAVGPSQVCAAFLRTTIFVVRTLPFNPNKKKRCINEEWLIKHQNWHRWIFNQAPEFSILYYQNQRTISHKQFPLQFQWNGMSVHMKFAFKEIKVWQVKIKILSTCMLPS